MSTTEDQGPVKATVIDLDPDQVIDADTSAPEPKASVSTSPARTRRMVLPLAIAMLAGVALGGWAYRNVLSSYFPSNEVTSLQTQVATLEKSNADATASVQQVDALTQKLAGDVNALQAKLLEFSPQHVRLEQQMSEAASRLAALEEAQKKLSGDVQTLASAPPVVVGDTAPPALPADLLARLDAVEKDIAALKAGIASKPDSTALSQSLSDLKSKIEAGVPFQSEYQRIAQFVPAAAGLETLARHAELGLPDAKGLALELAALIPSLPKPETSPAPTADKGWFESLGDTLGSVITIRDSGVSDWQAQAAQAQVFADTGDIAQAIAVIDKAEGAKPTALQQWRDRAAQRISLDAALSETVQSVMRELAARQ